MLNALELAGFKSFAEKTRLEFPAGVTCIVGPNGSGKSNVVDAVKWVLGSQSPKSLRGTEMTDVIFNGSASRRPMNSAEVTLEFDNRQEIFDLREPTVRVTRRVYRSGEGEYAINGVDCRLRDIRELLAGTGAGTQAYSIIEQGRVDAVLQSSPKERRALFEEAAGISRFRLKKQEAARRLARVDQNLLRLSDIVDEVEGRLRRVRSQAGKARRYREQADRVKELRTQLGLADWRVLTSQIESLEDRLTQIEATYTQHREQIEQGESRQAQGAGDAHASPDRLAEVQRELSTIREQIAAWRAIEETEADRLKDQETALAQSQRNLVALQYHASSDGNAASIQQLRRQLGETEAMLAKAKGRATDAQRACEQHDQQLLQLRAELEQQRDRKKAFKQRSVEQLRRLDALVARHELGESQIAERAESIAALQLQLDATSRERRETEDNADALAQQLAESESAKQSAEQQAENRRTQLSQLQQDLAKTESTAAGQQNRLAVLEDAETRLQTLRDDMSRLLKPTSGQNGPLATIRGLVADVLHVDFDTASMIEAALGQRAQHLVVDDGEGLMLALARDNEALTTRATFQRLDCTVAGTALDRIDLSGEAGVMGRADHFVETEPEYASLVTRLLGRVWLVDTLDTATGLAATKGRGLSFVTFAGELITPDGQIALGPQSDAGGLLTRRKQIASIKSSLSGSDQRLDELRGSIVTLQTEISQADSERKRQGSAHAKLAKQLNEHQSRIAALAERQHHLEDRKRQLTEEQLSNSDGLEKTRQEIKVARLEQSKHGELLAPIEQELAKLDKQIAEFKRELQRENNEATEARVAIARHEQHTETLNVQIEQLQSDSSQRTDADQEALVALEEATQRLAACQHRLLEARSELAEHYWLLEQLTQRERLLALAKRQEQAEQKQISATLAKLRRQMENLQAERQQVTLDAERHRLQRASLAERILEDYDIDLAAAARDARMDDAEESSSGGARSCMPADRADLEKELDQLRGEVGAVQSVNLESLDELDELETRFAELSAQYQDLSQAKASLQQLTARISNDSRQLFLATIEEVRGHFRELFRQLFGGGEADIVMTDVDDTKGNDSDPLEAGIDIAASPPGKELRSLSLLSGGERTMTCVALLLAVFRTKPSPFCILDEVDAALDEANIGRFNSVLSEFLSSTQFIVVTHSKKTMTGADTLYGVTMEESGVSKQVAVRFEDVGEDGQISPAATLRRATQPPQSRAA